MNFILNPMEAKDGMAKRCCLYCSCKFKTQSPAYLFKFIPTAKKNYITRNDDKLTHFKVNHNYLITIEYS